MQLDVKRPIPLDNFLDALELARKGRQAMLNAMENECKDTLLVLHPEATVKSTTPRMGMME